jgi:hypothetical protein
MTQSLIIPCLRCQRLDAAMSRIGVLGSSSGPSHDLFGPALMAAKPHKKGTLLRAGRWPRRIIF